MSTQTVTLSGEVSKLAGDGGATKPQQVKEATVKHLKTRFCSLLRKCTPLHILAYQNFMVIILLNCIYPSNRRGCYPICHNQGCEMLEHLPSQWLVHILLVLPVSSAMCERILFTDVRASLHTDTVEDLIRISIEGPSLEDYDAKESVASWFSQGQRTRRPSYRCWPSEEHLQHFLFLNVLVEMFKSDMFNLSSLKHFKHEHFYVEMFYFALCFSLKCSI